jgi:hypothetical protein
VAVTRVEELNLRPTCVPHPGNRRDKEFETCAAKHRRRNRWLKRCTREEVQQFSWVPNSLAQTATLFVPMNNSPGPAQGRTGLKLVREFFPSQMKEN